MLLVLMTTEDTELATTSVLHLWYSGRVTRECLRSMDRARSIVKYVCKEVERKELSRPRSRKPKTYRYKHKFGASSIVMDFAANGWKSLLRYFDPPPKFTGDDMEKRRQATMLSGENRDYIDYRYLLRTIPGWAPSADIFRLDGILVPTGLYTSDFTFPNPTLAHDDKGEWPMDGMADPLAGWPLAEVFATESAAKNDIYGKLYNYVRSQLAIFHRRLSTTEVKFEMWQEQVQQLGPWFVKQKHEPYDRIEVRTDLGLCI